jgi:hypothetical protein
LPIASMSPFLNLIEAMPITKEVSVNTHSRGKLFVSGFQRRTRSLLVVILK